MKMFKFPGGEMHVVLPNNLLPTRWDLWSSDDIMVMLLAVNAHRANPNGHKKNELHLIVPYVPYARQDRITQIGEPLSARVIADLINSLNAVSVTIWDPHSDVISALINNCIVTPQHEIIKASRLSNNTYDGIIAPDAGAIKKAQKVASLFQTKLYVAQKTRDTATGDITGTTVVDHDGGLARGGHFLVADDICDGGRTFVNLAKALPESCTADLYVTHGIFSNGPEILLKYYERIYSANIHPGVDRTYSYLVEI